MPDGLVWRSPGVEEHTHVSEGSPGTWESPAWLHRAADCGACRSVRSRDRDARAPREVIRAGRDRQHAHDLGFVRYRFRYRFRFRLRAATATRCDALPRQEDEYFVRDGNDPCIAKYNPSCAGLFCFAARSPSEGVKHPSF